MKPTNATSASVIRIEKTSIIAFAAGGNGGVKKSFEGIGGVWGIGY